MNQKAFTKWLKEYTEFYLEVLKTWGNQMIEKGYKKDSLPNPPKGLHEYASSLFISFRNEYQTKKLVWATWLLAISTIILSIITLILK